MKKFLIIGGSSGIGKAVANQLSANGHEVFATYCKHPTQNEKNIHFQHFDVLQDDVDQLTIPEQLNGVVYAPGNINLKPFSRVNVDEMINDFNLHVTGAVKVLQKAFPILRKTKDSSVVLFSSVAAQHGFPYHTHIGIAKGAIEGLTKSLAAEWAPKIRINAIAPSLTNTNIAKDLLNTDAKIEANNNRHPLKRIGEAEDIANTANFLLNDQSSWITGQIFHVDGGISSLKI